MNINVLICKYLMCIHTFEYEKYVNKLDSFLNKEYIVLFLNL